VLGSIWKQVRLLCTLQLQRGSRGKCLVCLPLNTSLYISPTMILHENMKPIEHVLFDPIWILSHLMCASKHCKVKLPLYHWTHWSCWWVYHFKKHRYHAISHNSLETHTGGLKNRYGWKKTSPKTRTTVDWSERLKIYCRVIVTQ